MKLCANTTKSRICSSVESWVVLVCTACRYNSASSMVQCDCAMYARQLHRRRGSTQHILEQIQECITTLFITKHVFTTKPVFLTDFLPLSSLERVKLYLASSMQKEVCNPSSNCQDGYYSLLLLKRHAWAWPVSFILPVPTHSIRWQWKSTTRTMIEGWTRTVGRHSWNVTNWCRHITSGLLIVVYITGRSACDLLLVACELHKENSAHCRRACCWKYSGHLCFAHAA